VAYLIVPRQSALGRKNYQARDYWNFGRCLTKAGYLRVELKKLAPHRMPLESLQITGRKKLAHLNFQMLTLNISHTIIAVDEKISTLTAFLKKINIGICQKNPEKRI
jgi:hypothetical protein